jgi:ribosomal protein S18 acetylase RimI-like enzyme
MIRLTSAEVLPAAEMLARAFGDDPMLAHLLPQAESRAERAFHLFRCVVQYGVLFGEVYATSSRMEGVAVWLPPPETDPSFAKMLKVGVVSLPLTAGVRCALRFWNLDCHLSRVWRRYGGFPHWYLGLLGVAPRCQGQGYGSTLVAPMLVRCDQENLRCCVDTANEKNTAFYRRFGFSVVHQAPVPRTALGYWFMVRDVAPA